jgi:hypothetical protein
MALGDREVESLLELIRAREEKSERLIDWVQLVMVAIFATLYVIAPQLLDAVMSMLG